MARLSSPTSSEGFGFTFADKVGALALLSLLDRTAFGEHQLGVVTKVQFGQRPARWHFDDIVLTLDNNGEQRRLACSIKSGNHLTNAGLSNEIVSLVWEQAMDCDPFMESSDVLALVQPSPTSALLAEMGELYRWATRQQTGQLETWLQPHVAGDLKRTIVESVKLGGDRDDAQRFFRMFRLLTCDLDEPYDQTARTAQARCMAVLRNPTEALAKSLWTHLCRIAADTRGSAGALTLTELLSELAPHFLLREHPRVEQDLNCLRAFSVDRHLASVRAVIGSDLHLPTADGIQQVSAALENAPIAILLGASGSGKSVMLKEFVEQSPDGELRLYFRADLNSVGPTSIERHLALQHSLAECLSEGRFGLITLVVDQLDRLLTDEQIADVVELLESTKHLRPRLRLVFGCQTAEAERVLSRLSQAVEPSEIERTVFNPDEEAMFKAVIDRYPTLRNIAFRSELRSIFLRAKNLDLLVGRLDQLGQLSGHQLTSQKQFIDWFWDKYVSEGAQGIARSTLMQELGDLQAATLSPHINPRSVQDRQSLDALRGAGLVSGDDQGVTFQHDLYGDWARLRSIETNESDFQQFLHERGTNPLWLRAIRLWSAVLLETKGARYWHARFDAFSEDDGAGWMIRDAMLDGLGLAAGSYQYLSELSNILFENDGKLLKRFLSRFLFATTWPDDRLAQAFSGGSTKLFATFRSQFRIPQWYLWWPVIRFIVDNPTCGKFAPKLVIEILVSWLDSLPKGAQTSKETSLLALSIAEEFLKIPNYAVRDDDKNHGMRVCRSVFLALKHIPEEAQAFLKKAVGLVGEDRFSNAELISGERYVNSHSLFGHQKARIVGPWPSGPVAEQNKQFREFVLMGGGLREVFAHSPQFAREVILACAIEPPHEEEPDHGLSGLMIERGLCLTDEREFYPPLYDKNLFQVMFSLDAAFAVDLCVQLAEFATDRWHEMLHRQSQDDSITINIKGKKRKLVGGAACYGWHRDGIHCADVVVAGLMSLEKFLYDQLEARSGEEWVKRIVQGMQSTAVLGLLASVGRKYPSLFASELRFLHFSEIVQWWDIGLVVGSEGHQMISWQGHSEAEIKAANEWHSMPQRRTALKFFAFYVLNDADGREQAKRACARWKKLAKHSKGEGRAALENLGVVYDIKNYSFEQRPDGVLIQCNLPDDMQKAASEHLAKSERPIRPMLLAHRCRELLNSEPNLSEDDLRALHAQAVAIKRDDVTGRSHIHAEDAWCGVAALLLLHYREWVRSESGMEKWCIETLVSTCLDPPPASEFEISLSVSEDQWCHFAAQALPLIWSERPSDPKTRICIANLVQDFRYKTIAYLARPLFSLRAKHPELYYQAVHLHRAWAVNLTREHEVERRAHVLEEDLHLLPNLEPNDYPNLRKSFVKGELPVELPLLPMPDMPPLENQERSRFAGHDRQRAHPKVDTARLGYFVANLPAVDSVKGSDQAEVIERWSELFYELIVEIRGNPADEGRSVHWYTNEWDMFERFGFFAASVNDSTVAKGFLQAIRGIVRFAEHHVERFFDGFFKRLLRSHEPGSVAELNWLLAIELFLGTKSPASDSWTSQDYGWHEWEDWLVGNTPLLRNFFWKDDHKAFVARHAILFESWVRAGSSHARSLSSCLRFLSLPSAELIRADACFWLKEVVDESLLDDRHEKVAEEIASFLELARSSVSDGRRTRPKVFEAYLALLAMLNRRNNRLAMQLLEDVATLH